VPCEGCYSYDVLEFGWTKIHEAEGISAIQLFNSLKALQTGVQMTRLGCVVNGQKTQLTIERPDDVGGNWVVLGLQLPAGEGLVELAVEGGDL